MPRVVWVVVAIVVIVLVVVGAGSSSSPGPPSPQGPGNPTSTMAVPTSPSPTVTTPISVVPTPRTTPPVASQKPPGGSAFAPGDPAYQHIPFTGMGLQISLSSVEADGRMGLYVYSDSLTVPQMQAAYPGFLALYHDSGSGYVPAFVSALGRP